MLEGELIASLRYAHADAKELGNIYLMYLLELAIIEAERKAGERQDKGKFQEKKRA